LEIPPKVLLLASASPRRSDLLAEAGLKFSVRTSVVEELVGGLPPRELVLSNARLKSLAVARDQADAVVLGADTIVVLDGEVFGKPGDLSAAREMLGRLSGRVHEVLTAVCLATDGGSRRCEFIESTRVKFYPLTPEEIESYLKRIDPLDKAGAYAAQDDDGELIEQIEGLLSNVIGLPVERVTEMIDQHFADELLR